MSSAITLFALALLGLTLLVSGSAQAVEFEPGLGVDQAAEKQLEDALEKVIRLSSGTPKASYKELAQAVFEARKYAAILVATIDKGEQAVPDKIELPERPPVVLVGKASVEDIGRLWWQQFRMNVRAAKRLLEGNEKTVREWVGWPEWKERHSRIRPLADALREAHKLTLLLDSSPAPLKVARGKLLFSDDFGKGTDNWLLYGPCETTMTEKGLRRRNLKPRHADTATWTRREFEGNFLFEFTFIPNVGGKGPGVLFAICARPVKEGTDLSVSVGETMAVYNFGIHAYHFSIHRSGTGLSNGRKVGRGLRMLCSGADPAEETGKAYRVGIGKWGATIFLLVNDTLIHQYFDARTYGPVLTAGSVGMRHWGGLDATYADVKVYRLVPVEVKAQR